MSDQDRGTVTVLFTDVEGSTQLHATLGDDDARSVLRRRESLVREIVAAHGGDEIKALGDGVMVAFTSARRAIECAVDLQRAISGAADRDARPVRVRMGLNAGDAIHEAGDLFGQTVNMASRIAAKAAGGQILVSSVVRDLAGGVPGVRFIDLGPRSLKGIPGRHRLHAVEWERDRRADELRVRLLGPFEVEGLPAERLGRRKTRTLVKLLAVACGEPVSLDRVVDVLWDTPPAKPGDQVAVLVSRLRAAIGPERITRTDAGYVLHADWVDVPHVQALVREAERRLEAGGYAAARTAAQAALALVRGPLLACEPDAAWVEAERAAASRWAARARAVAASAALAAGDAADAAEMAEQSLAADPFDEAALRTLMAAHSAQGRPASALHAYERVRELLASELGVDPARETAAVHEAILRSEPVPGVPERAPVPVEPARAALHGRKAEQAVLAAALRADSMQIVVVDGEPGIGKSVILDAFAEDAREGGAEVLRGRSDELGRDLPLQAVLDALDGHLLRAGPAVATEVLGAEAALLAPLLVRAPVERPEEPFVVADPAMGQAALFGALLAVLERIAARNPVVLILDDLHLSGRSTVEWLHFARRRGEGLRILVVAARRSGEGEPVHADRVVEVGPLTLEAAEAIVGPDRAAALHVRSGGNPLFLVELAAADPLDEIPASVRDAVAARLARAGDGARTIQTAAVIGPEVELDLLSAVLDAPPRTLLEHLEAGVGLRLLEEHGRGFRFRHELVRETIEAQATASRRALVHREAGRALHARSDADPLEVAHHARLGGDDERAARALVAAARLAADRYDWAEADRLLAQSIGLRPTPEAHVARGRVALIRDRFADASADATQAVALGAGAEALELGAQASYFSRDFARAAALAAQGAASATDSTVRAGCIAIEAKIRHASGRVEEASALIDEALAADPMVSIRWAAALIRVHQGRSHEAVELARAAGRDPPRGLAGGVGRLYGIMAEVLALGLLGRPVEALAATDELEAEVDRRGTHRWVGRAHNVRAWILRNLVRFDEADDLNTRAADESASVAAHEPLVYALLDLADASLLRGDPVRCRDLLERVRPILAVDFTYRWRTELRTSLVEARLALAEGRPESALEEAVRLEAGARATGARRQQVLGALCAAQARAMLGEPIDLDATKRLLDELGSVAGLEAWRIAAEVAHATGVEAWFADAERLLGSLADRAGEDRDSLTAAASATLSRLRATSPPRARRSRRRS